MRHRMFDFGDDPVTGARVAGMHGTHP
jgi:hypothetical protein